MHVPIVIRLAKSGESSTISDVVVSYNGTIPFGAKLKVLAGECHNVVVVSGQRATLYTYKTFIPMKPTATDYRVEIGLDGVVYLHPLDSEVNP